MQLDCGIPMRRIVAWLDDELRLERECGADRWTYRKDAAACRIAVAPLGNRELGAIAIERTELSAEGDSAAVEAFMRLFTLRFASAGG